MIRKTQYIGLAAGTLSGIWMLAQYYLGILYTPFGKYSGYMGIPILFTAIYLALRLHRHQSPQGTMEIKEGIKTGLMVSVLCALVVALFTYVYYAWVNPHFIHHIIPQAVAYWKQLSMFKATELHAQLLKLKADYSPFKQATSGVFVTLFLGLLFSIVCSMLMRKK